MSVLKREYLRQHKINIHSDSYLSEYKKSESWFLDSLFKIIRQNY